MTEKETTAQIFARVAPYLGDGWSAEVADPDYPSMGGYLVHVDGARLHAYGGYRQGRTDRLAISGIYPDRPDGSRNLPYILTGPDARKPERVEITVAKDRDPKAIAAEITRRLLPTYLPDLAALAETDARAVVAASSQADAIDQLCKAFPLASPNGDGVRWYSSKTAIGYGDVMLYHDGSKGGIEIHSASFDTVARIVALLAEIREEDLAASDVEINASAHSEDQ